MPCYTPPPSPEEEYAFWEEKLRHNSPTANALCELCKLAIKSNLRLSPKAAKWWDEHSKIDAYKLALVEKKARELEAWIKLLQKLNPRERRLLGIK